MSPELLHVCFRLRTNGGGGLLASRKMSGSLVDIFGSRTMSAQPAKRAACDELEALRSLLQEATEKVAKVEGLLCEPCKHTERVKVYPSGRRDNGECWYVCVLCGDRE